MAQDNNPIDEDSSSTLQLQLEGTLERQLGNNISVVDINATESASKDGRDIVEIQRMVCKKMHKAMSPISAISGYLELMKMLLEKETDSDSLKRYRDKIEEGVGEIGEIIEELHEIFDRMDVEDSGTSVQAKGAAPNKNRRVG